MSEGTFQFDWAGAETIVFDTVRENWQTYHLSDGSQMRIKLVLASVWRSKNQHHPVTGDPIYTHNTVTVSALAQCAQALKGSPTLSPPTQLTPEKLSESIEETVEFDLAGKQDEWNVYNLADGSVMRLRPNITDILRTKFRAPNGDPLYSIASGPPSVRVKANPKLVKKPTSIQSRSPPKHLPTYG